jgi:sulfhydrogenase subunit beta (sulfur reductase)
MTIKDLTIGSILALPKTELDGLIADLRAQGFQTIGPRLQDEGIVYAEIAAADDLPRGLVSEQKPGSYNLKQSGSGRYFDFIPGSQSWKQFLFPPRQALFSARRDRPAEGGEGPWQYETDEAPAPRYALVGVRACELAAIHIQDKIFLRPDFQDPIYRARREGLFILAVNCLSPNATCFCESMGTGPRVKAGYDLCLTELDDQFLVEVGSELGRSLLAERTYELSSAFVQNAAAQALEHAAGAMGRQLDTSDLPGLLTENLDAQRWTDVGKRCLSCANCTLVCPTCFCWEATDQVDILGTQTRRERVWDSCFNRSYSYVFGGNTRPTIRSRYRQWLTHKLGTWKEQFGMLGCVGCGRCITWCPAGIDLTAEVAAIREEVGS